MKRIGLVVGSPLLAQGLGAALADAAGDHRWQALAMAGFEAADAYVLQVDSELSLARLPSGVPAVVVGADAATIAAARAADPTRPWAWLDAAATPAQLRAAVAAVLEGLSVHASGLVPAEITPAGVMAPSASAATSAHDAPAAPEHDPLTARELEVFELLAKGLSNRDIGGVLGISAHTAKFHVGQILAKVGAATRAEAVHLGLRLGLIGF